MRFNSPVRSVVFSQLEMASAVSSPMPRTFAGAAWREAREDGGASPKCSSNCRTRTGPTCSIKFNATSASLESMRGGIAGLALGGKRVACCVLRVACCVLRVACCVLRELKLRYRGVGQSYLKFSLSGVVRE